MKQLQRKNYFLFQFILILALLLSGCGSGSDSPSSSQGQSAGNQNSGTSSQGNSSNIEDQPNHAEPVKGSRDNTSTVLLPEAPGTDIHTCDVATIDVSHSAEGYIMATYTGTSPKVKFQVKGPDGITYTYNLHGNGYEVFPLTAGDGQYSIGVYENISGTKYSTTLSCKIEVAITNEFGPYLYPNQYVNFDASSLPIAKASDLAFPANTDIEVVEQVYNYIISNFTYDYDKASSVVSGYLPVIDEVFKANTGICFDYAAVMATMLRTQNIPTRLEVGYMGEEYHAWISVYIEDIGWINGLIEFNGVDWNMLDPTFASASKQPTSFITQNSKYTTKYVY